LQTLLDFITIKDMGHQERKLREKEQLKNSLLAAALSIAEKEGWQALTIRKIADAIEYTAPIVYEHFANKEELMEEIIQQGYKTMFDSYLDLFSQNLDSKRLLLEISMKHWDFAFENKVLYQLMFSLERCKPRDEFIKVMTDIRDSFAQTTKKDGDELSYIIFNWICLMNGTISTIMMIDGNKHPHHERKIDIDPKGMYRSFIERFLNSIS
jgi:AcrR family transcriptional regulator